MPSPAPLSPEAEKRLLEAAGYYHARDLEGALVQVRALLKDTGPSAPVLELLGLVLLSHHEPQKAADALRQALRLNPDSPTILFALGVAFSDQGLWRDARDCYDRLLAAWPQHVEAHFNRARALEELGAIQAAQAAYAACLEMAPHHLEAAAHYAALLEESNQLEEARRWVTRARAGHPGHVLTRMVAAQLDLRTGHFEEALHELNALASEHPSPMNQAVIAGRRVRALDALGRYPDAFRAAEEGHTLLAHLEAGHAMRGPYGIETVDRLVQHIPNMRTSPATADPNLLGHHLVFLVGFPRSGTTLLDRMLAAHPDIAVLEEENPFSAPLTALLDLLDQNVTDPLSHPLVQSALASATQRIASLKPGRDGRIVDKLPLNSIYAGWLHLLLPEARFVVAIRDPRDVCLSCFLQVFVPNPAMRQFWSLAGTVHYYDRVMTILTQSQKRIIPDSRIRMVHYEALLGNPVSILRHLTDFLGIRFVPAMAEPHRSIRGERIGTPSYDQVARPLYPDSIGRWRNYRTELLPILPRLESWVRHWGYESAE
ncbi:MAG: tetratricopeptide repeat-containing sulfotransferase family protein [Gammaproteobacteria bacterium]